MPKTAKTKKNHKPVRKASNAPIFLCGTNTDGTAHTTRCADTRRAAIIPEVIKEKKRYENQLRVSDRKKEEQNAPDWVTDNETKIKTFNNRNK